MKLQRLQAQQHVLTTERHAEAMAVEQVAIAS
jgi:hypothetical protein